MNPEENLANLIKIYILSSYDADRKVKEKNLYGILVFHEFNF